jgi:hypothetical protein
MVVYFDIWFYIRLYCLRCMAKPFRERARDICHTEASTSDFRGTTPQIKLFNWKSNEFDAEKRDKFSENVFKKRKS